jgi:hypothetical protein
LTEKNKAEYDCIYLQKRLEHAVRIQVAAYPDYQEKSRARHSTCFKVNPSKM